MNDDFDASLVARYGESAPRYTSYPPATQFHSQFGPDDLARVLTERPAGRPWSLYVHVPFCESVCYYCACNKTVTKHHDRAGSYVARVARELALLSPLLGARAPLDQLHWGGGTPTFLSHDEMRTLMCAIAERFALRPDDGGEYSIEIDPRHASDATLTLLRSIGFNRLSLGVQDFDPQVQRAINREQSFALVRHVAETARSLGFRSLSVDLIYGLPRQTRDSFARTIDRLLDIAPDRVSLFNYAHLPERFKPQRRINAAEIPDGLTKIAILSGTAQALARAGYVYIGLDHFAKADDELALAQRDRTLARNFQGYSTRGHLDVLGVGASAVSRIGGIYSQNAWDLKEYETLVDQGTLPVRRGFELSADDQLRREVINDLLCHMECDVAAVEARHGLRFATYFASELARLEPFIHDGLVEMDGGKIHVTARGQILVRAVCAIFDRYLLEADRRRFSRVV
ncbi:oxygen-independent coproporphyrinogen III oxidase [Acidiferrobacter sp.]|jgi:oxygen-independent coproporphyrinogen-3 oxidase|uniref:oxygen-independent coproporphyrinogen III oxidase n=1 Tax=Acidiferrobacter sp. TaxID=1872107 RepID=UPI00263621BD|nr:oxygen-independent coproporphyrinogen III oxidase [Acidiferrobacter sp.]